MRVLLEKEAEDFLARNRFNVVPRLIAKNDKQVFSKANKLGFPVVVKLLSRDFVHKTEKGAVEVDIRDKKELKKAVNELKKIKADGFLVQKFIPGDWFLVGLKKDSSFGHVVAFGLGGIYTEVMKDVSFRVCPLSKKDVDSMLKETKAFGILSGARGRKHDINSIKRLLLRISRLPQKHPEIVELDINPLVVNAKQAVIVDARVVLE
ncbi:MAG: acetate--CoA ligase family protein [Candidatus Nanoarchaeia archaeon]